MCSLTCKKISAVSPSFDHVDSCLSCSKTMSGSASWSFQREFISREGKNDYQWMTHFLVYSIYVASLLGQAIDWCSQIVYLYAKQ